MDYSVVIPHYNSYDTLKELLKTIPDSNRIEIIIIDDNSEKECKKKLKKLKLSRNNVTIIFRSLNQGAGACRNTGINRSTGKWLIFADSDDLFTNDWLTFTDNHLSSSADVVFFKPTSFYEYSNIESSRHVIFEELINMHKTVGDLNSIVRIKYLFVVPWSKMIKKSFVEKNSIYFEEISLSNDLLFSAKVGFFSNEIKSDNSVIYSVRLSSGSMTTNITKERYLIRLNAWIDYIDFLTINLTDLEQKELHLNGMHKLLDIIRYKLGVDTFMRTVKILNTKKIKLIDTRIFNLKFLSARIKIYKKKWKDEEKVTVKKRVRNK